MFLKKELFSHYQCKYLALTVSRNIYDRFKISDTRLFLFFNHSVPVRTYIIFISGPTTSMHCLALRYCLNFPEQQICIGSLYRAQNPQWDSVAHVSGSDDGSCCMLGSACRDVTPRDTRRHTTCHLTVIDTQHILDLLQKSTCHTGWWPCVVNCYHTWHFVWYWWRFHHVQRFSCQLL